MTIRAHFDGRVFVPVDRVDLQKDQLVELEVRSASATDPGSPAAVLKLMDGMASTPPELIDELDRAIEQAKLSVNDQGVFDHPGRN